MRNLSSPNTVTPPVSVTPLSLLRLLLHGVAAAACQPASRTSTPHPDATLTPKNPNSSILKHPPWLIAAEVVAQLRGLTVRAARRHTHSPSPSLQVAVKPLDPDPDSS